MSAEAYIITCNDSVEHVVIGNPEVAETKKKELRYVHRQEWIKGNGGPSAHVMYGYIFNWQVRATSLTVAQ